MCKIYLNFAQRFDKKWKTQIKAMALYALPND